MKRLVSILIILILVCSASISMAVDWTWDQHTDMQVVGYNFYWKEAASTDTPFHKNVPGIDNIVYTVNDINLKPDIEYDFWVTAYSAKAESDPSTVVKYTRVDVYTPPADNVPTDEYPVVAPDTAQGFRQNI